MIQDSRSHMSDPILDLQTLWKLFGLKEEVQDVSLTFGN